MIYFLRVAKRFATHQWAVILTKPKPARNRCGANVPINTVLTDNYQHSRLKTLRFCLAHKCVANLTCEKSSGNAF